MKRVFLFILTNLAVMLVLSITLRIFGFDRYLDANGGINYSTLLGFSLVVGFGGSIISLLMSKTVAKASVGAQVIDPNNPRNQQEAWLVDTVYQIADRAQIGRPEVAIYEGEPNAFATGANKNNALVAVSTGLLQGMTEEEVSAVLGHEVAHIANGDMVTLTLIQGVVNTFVVFISRIVGGIIDKAIFRSSNDSNSQSVGFGYYICVMVCEVVFGLFASIIVAWFSRQREFRADAGSSVYLGSTQPMINALARLNQMHTGELPKTMSAFGISGNKGFAALFSSHPPLEVRIAALQNRAQ